MKKGMKITVLVVSFLVVSGLSVFGTLYFTGFIVHRGNFNRGNFQPTQEQINDVTSFFNNNPALSDAQNYCDTNRNNCFYYCRAINSNNEICSQIMNYTRNFGGGVPTS